MMEERRIAEAAGATPPVWDTIEETHDAYNTNLRTILDVFDPSRDALCVASHNIDSCNLGA